MLDISVRFSVFLQRERKVNGLTLEKVAQRSGTHKGYISGLENEKVNPPSVKMCVKLGKLFKFSGDYITYIAYRDKAPKPVQRRIEVLEILKGTVQDYRRLTMLDTSLLAPGSRLQHNEQLAETWATIARTLGALNSMWETPTNGNGNGNGH